jgi:hypothetical protein
VVLVELEERRVGSIWGYMLSSYQEFLIGSHSSLSGRLLESFNYCLACRAGGADDDLFIIEFLPIYLTDTARAWLDHLSRNTFDS